MNTNLHHRPWFLFLLFILASASPLAAAPPTAATYGTKSTFQKGVPLTFPAFTLTYVGERHVTTSKFPRGFLFHDFDVTHKDQTVRVSWSSGTGDIGPAPFRINNKSFTLELSISDKRGPLKKNELVINRG